MSATSARHVPSPLNPIQAMLIGGLPTLFLGAFFSDLAYRASFHMQWANFASWFLAGAAVFGAFAVLWSFVDVIRGGVSRRRHLTLLLVLLALWIVGIVNALVHAKDAWAIMPEGLYLSAISAVLAVFAAWLGFSRNRLNEVS